MHELNELSRVPNSQTRAAIALKTQVVLKKSSGLLPALGEKDDCGGEGVKLWWEFAGWKDFYEPWQGEHVSCPLLPMPRWNETLPSTLQLHLPS